MLSIFPDLFSYQILAITIIRIVIGLIVVFFGYLILFKYKIEFSEKMINNNYPFAYITPWIFGILHFTIGFFLIAGFLTQITAIVSAYIFLNLGIIEGKENEIFKQSILFYTLMTILSLSLLFLGPGIYAIDLPL